MTGCTGLLMGRQTVERSKVSKTDKPLGTVLVQEGSQPLEPAKVLAGSNVRVRDYTDLH